MQNLTPPRLTQMESIGSFTANVGELQLLNVVTVVKNIFIGLAKIFQNI